MAVKGSFPIKVDSNVHGFARVLKSAACEWLLLFLLLLDAAFLYFLKKFAQYCELQLPCILCSRLDHILGKENPDFYVNLLCNNHKSEISSLVSCHNHGKLVDVHGMCEECLFSFAKNDSREEAYKILVGKLGSECIQKPLVNLDINSGSLTTKFCSCCSKPWRSRPNVQKMVQSKLPSALVSNPEIPPPKSPGHRCLNSQQGLKNRRDRFSLPTKPLVLGSKDHDSLSHVGYTEVKISSDSDSDFPFSDDDDLINVPRNRKINEFLSRQGSKFTPKSQYADVFPAVQRQKSTPATSNLMFSHLEPEKGETTTPRLISNGDLRKGLGELNWQQLIKKASPLAPELVSLDDIPLSSSAPKDSPAISADEGDRVSLSNTLDASGYTDFISHETALSSENVQLPARLSKENCIETKEMDDTGLTSAINHWESIDLNSTSTLSSRKDAAFVPNNNSVIGARDLAPIIIKDVKASSLLSEEIGSSTCNGNESAEKPSESKVSDTQTDSSSSNICPPVNGHFDEPRKIQNPSSNDTLMPPKSPSMERSQSLESLEESVSEIEGESLVDKLRRQVEYDKKCIKNLHKELDEERNASAIAANQAMAMITKLQEEKAALNMEALQYLRMMEEQAEYDVDALEKANEMIAEKEKEIQELEAELDYFRIKYPEDFPEMN